MEYKKWNVLCVDGYMMKRKDIQRWNEPGTRWEDIPEDWYCPECGVGKDDFDMVEII